MKSPEASDPRAAEAADHAVPGRSTVDFSLVAQIFAEKIGDSFKSIEQKLSNMEEKFNIIKLETAGIEDMVVKAIDRKMADMQQSIVAAISDYFEKTIVAYSEDDTQQNQTGQQT